MIKLFVPAPPFRCPESLGRHLISVFEGEYEVPLWGPKRILDIGANVGAFSLWAKYRWPGSVITAYEPNEHCWAAFEENVSGVKLERYAIGTPGIRPLYNGKNNLGEATLFQNACTDGTGIHVEVRNPLELPEADILKMDIEGAELEVLEPLMKTGRKFEAIVFEWHNGDLRRACDALLSEYVLTCSRVHAVERGTNCYVRRDLLP